FQLESNAGAQEQEARGRGGRRLEQDGEAGAGEAGDGQAGDAAAPERFAERRNLEDLWLSAFPIGTEWGNIDKIKEFNWNFQNLEKALEEGGELYGKTVYLFANTEPQQLHVNGEQKMVFVPTVVAVDCPCAPSDKVGINYVQRAYEEILPMRAMKMSWVPYVPLEDRLSRIEGLKTKIFTLHCSQRRSALKHLKTERVKKFDYCMPYYMSLISPEEDHDTTVDIIYPLEPPIVCPFDWEMDNYEEFTDDLVKAEELPEDEKENFKAKEARKEAIDNMDPEKKKAFENIKFHKFYPVNALDAPDLSIQKGRLHQ
uniref:Uncharacterized protein n=1 Tax=Aegilops tauschii subsp. strangulata TaxID=200361 RepID=A0A453TD85_AEGTS